MPFDPSKEDFKYWAFICYSHTDEKWADWLHKSLETYRIPKHLVGTATREGIVPKRLFPIFRDRAELPGSANLGEHIEAALRQSRYLIVICSPRAVHSKWVDQEIRMFKSWGREDRVLCLVIEGEPHSTTRPECTEPECMPEAVRFWVDNERGLTQIPTEPIAADARKNKDGKKDALLKILAGILGVEFDALKQREEERRIKQQRVTLAASAALLIIFSVIGAEFYLQRNEAISARIAAENEAENAKRARKEAIAAQEAAEAERQKAVAAFEKAQQSAVEAQKAREEAERAAQAAKKSADEEKLAKDKMREARDLEAKAHADAEQKKKRMEETLALSDFTTASRLIEEGNESKALAYLSRALRYDRENAAVVSRVISILSQRNWGLPKFEPLRHAAEVRGAQFSPDGRWILTRSENNVALWNVATGQHVFTVQHDQEIKSAAFSPDGKWFVTASADGIAQIWETISGQKYGEPLKHHGSVNYAVFSNDGKLVATASQEKTAQIWDVASTKLIAKTGEHDGPVQLVRFTPDGKSLITAAASSAKRWEVATGQPIGLTMSHAGGVYALAVSPNGKWILTASLDHTARLWDAITGEPVGQPMTHDDWIFDAKFSPDGLQVLTASSDTTARLWDIATGKCVRFRHDMGVNTANFSPNGRWIITACADGTARVWDKTGNPVCESLNHLIGVHDAQFSPDGRFVVTASADRTAKVWSISSGRPAVEPLRHAQQVNSAVFSPDGRWLATVSNDRTARIWDVKSARPATAPLRHWGAVISAAFSPDGKYLATGAEDGSAQVWEVASGKALFKDALDHKSWVNSVSFSPDGAWLVTASEDRRARVWDLQTGKLVYEPLKHEGIVKSASFSPDGRWIITASYSKTVKVWNAATREPVSPTMAHNGEIRSAVLSPDGKFLVTGSEDKTARVWNPATGEMLFELPHDAAVSIVAFVPRNVWETKKWIVTVSEKVARVWDISARKAVTEPLKHDENIQAVTFGPYGNLLVTASGKDLRIWEASSGRIVIEPIRHEKEIRSVAFSPDGNFVVTTSADQAARIWLASIRGNAPEWLRDMADAVGGYKLDNYGAAQLLQEQWTNFTGIQRLLANEPADNSFVMWGRWFLSDRSSRNISAFSATSMADYVRQRAIQGTPGALAEALDLQPNHGLALVKLATKAKEPAEAEFLSHLAESYSPKDADVLWIRAQVLQNLNRFIDAFAVMERALIADPNHTTQFGPEGADISVESGLGAATGWLPTAWRDDSPPSLRVTYTKLPEAAAPGVTALQMTAAGNQGFAELRGPRLVCRQSGRIIVEGWTRSSTRDDFSIGLNQFIDPYQKYKEQIVHTTSEWKPFKLSFSPLQDIAAEVRLTFSPGSTIQIAGVTCRTE